MKVSDDDLLLLWDAATRTGKSSVECAWHELKDELRALRNVAEAAKQLRDDEDGDQWNCQQRLFVALKEAGYNA